MKFKTCTKCKTEKPLLAFSKCATAKDLVRSQCKSCDAAYRADNQEKIKLRNEKWDAANRDKRLASSRKWQSANPDKVKEAAARRRTINIVKNRVYDADRYIKHVEKIKAQSAKWRAANPEKVRILSRNKRARKVAVGGTHTASDIKRLLLLQKGKCACCRTDIKVGYHVDHMMPLALNGSNDRLNLQLLCQPCNNHKSAKHPVDFMQQRGFLL